MMSKYSPMMALIAVVSGVSGCGTSLENRTMGGTAAGAATGAVFGGAFGGIGAAPGAALGAAAGATLGAFTEPEKVNFGEPLWEQYRRVGGDLPARQSDRGLVLTLDPVLFAFGSAALTPEGSGGIATIAEFLKEQPERHVLIEGHTDSIGAEDYNLDLSQWRAETVEQVLIDNGVEPGRLAILGLGEHAPVDGNDTDAGRERNRRVEVIIR